MGPGLPYSPAISPRDAAQWEGLTLQPTFRWTVAVKHQPKGLLILLKSARFFSGHCRLPPAVLTQCVVGASGDLGTWLLLTFHLPNVLKIPGWSLQPQPHLHGYGHSLTLLSLLTRRIAVACTMCLGSGQPHRYFVSFWVFLF